MTVDLQALKEKRDAAIRTFSCWECSAETFLEAYAQGERDFRFANLRAANLRFANLSAANLSAANLSAANLRFANLRFANLSDANLRAANLRDANLRAANLPGGFSIIQIGPVGSRRDYTVATRLNEVNEIRTGCFSGSLDEFIAAVARKDADDPYRREYETMVIPVLKAFFAQFEAKSEEA